VSVITATFSRTRETAEWDLLERLHDATYLLTPSRSEWTIAGGAALACRHTAASDNPTGLASLTRADGTSLHGVADARIDNRRELIGALARVDAADADADVELLLKAYAAWGDDAFAHIVGDFAVVIFDERRQRLVCARDPVGVKVLYTRLDAERLCVSSQLAALLSVSEATPGLNLEYIADHLANGVARANTTTTPYRGIERLRPGHLLIVDRDQARTIQYWDWNCAPPVEYRQVGDYALHVRALFTDAVRASLRTPGGVWTDLSGGLDSSSIACVASECLAADPGRARLSAVSQVFGEAATSDERAWSAHVRSKYDLAEHVIDGDRHHPVRGLRELVEHWEEPHPSLLVGDIERGYHELIGGDPASVLLTGIAAEAVVMGKQEGPVHFADRLARFEWGTLAREAGAWQRTLRVPLANLLRDYAVRPWIGRRLVGYGWQRAVHAWIRPEFDRRFHLKARATHGSMPQRFASPADQLHYEKIGRVPGFLLRGYLDKCTDIRYPFLYRPLVELMLRLPWDVKLRASESKTLLRQAMRGVLPEAIRTRRIGTSFDHAVYLGIRKEWATIESLIDSSCLAALGCVAPDALRQAARLARAGHAPDLHGLVSTLALEAWLAGAFGRRRSPRREAAFTSAVAGGGVGERETFARVEARTR
jgi:asparagine synthase (glutamine-hydrolysing)